MTKTQSYQDRAKSAMGDGGPQSERIQKVFKEHQERLLAISKENLTIAQKSFEYKQKLIDKVQALAQAENISLEKRKQAQELLNKLKEKELELAKTITDETETQQKMSGGGIGGGGTTGDGGPAGRLSALGAKISSALSSAVPLIAAAGGVAKFLGNQTQFQQVKSQEQAQIAQNKFSASGADLLMSGRGAEYAIYNRERMRAMENARIAQTGMIAREAGGGAIGLASGLGGSLGAAGLAAKFGATGLASILGGPMGLAVAGGAGLLAGTAMGGGQLVGGMKSFIQGEGFMEGVDRARQMELYQDAVRNQAAERAKDPFKEKAFEYYAANQDRYQSIMRKSGISMQELMGSKGGVPSVDAQGNFTFSEASEGLLGGGAGLYTQDKIIGNMQAIGAAGGTSAQMRNPRASLDMQRAYGIESAPQILGALSGQLMGGQQSLGVENEVTKRMLAAAFSTGIDTSKMGAETEKFLQASTKFVLESGAKTELGMAAVAGSLGNFTSEGSMAGISSATEAKSRFEQVTGSGSPAYMQALKLASMRKEFPELNEDELAYLSQASADQIAAGDDPLLKRLGEKVGGMEKLQKGSMKSIERGMTFSPTQEKKLTSLREKQSELANSPMMRPELRDKLQSEISNMEEDLGFSMSRTGIAGDLRGQKLKDFISGSSKTFAGVEAGAGVNAKSREMNIMDLLEMANAKADQAKNDRVRDYDGEFSQELESFKNTNAKVIIELEKLAETLKSVNGSEKTLDFWGSLMSGQFQYNTKPSGD